MTDIYATVGNRGREIPQLEQAEDEQVKNNAGGYTFSLTDAQQLRRFLVLGTAAGTYYANAKSHTLQAAEVIKRMADRGDMDLVNEILDVSLGGLAPKQEPTLLALAIACSSKNTALRTAALDAVPKVCRTFTMLAIFMSYVKTHRGMGRGLRRAIARFYEEKNADQVALQMIKYRQRSGYTHRDALRIAHPKAPTDGHRAAYDFACGRTTELPLPTAIIEFETAQRADRVEAVTASIELGRLPWEAIPDRFVNDKAVLEKLLPGMGATALLRQLPRFARASLTDRFGGTDVSKFIVERLTNAEFIRGGRLHPYQVLLARTTYAAGGTVGVSAYTRGRSTGEAYTPDRKIVDALDHAFELAFQNVVPSNTRTGLFLDVSGSMGWSLISNSNLSAREGSAAMALATMRSEPFTLVAGFTSASSYSRLNTSAVSLIDVSARDSLTSILSKVSNLPFGGTDCSAPMKWALANEPTLETFIIYTDNETWAGTNHPHKALQAYRKATGIDAKMIVVGMTATNFTIADPKDRGMLDVVGFDASAPRVMAEFSAGKL